MNGIARAQSPSRRRFVQALFGGAALLIAGHAGNVRAEPTKAPDQGPGELKSSCDQHGGTYIESKKDDVQACFWPNKGKTVCKFSGKGCYNYDPPKAVTTPTGPFADPFGSVNWPELEALAETDTPEGGTPPTSPANVLPEAASRRHGKKRRGKRRKH